MPVWISRHHVGTPRHRTPVAPRALLVWCVVMASSLLGCGESPERLLMGRWQESAWSYERLDLPEAEVDSWSSTADLVRQMDRRIVRHEAESWQFFPDGTLLISGRDGKRQRAQWRLKGRGHVLTILADHENGLEVYDIKELNENELVLHYEIGMEVRGIAKLNFRTATPQNAVPEA